MKKQLLILVLLLGLLWPLSAESHAELVRSEPANGAQVETSPAEVTIWYSQGVQIATITVVDADGVEVHTDVIVDTDDWTIVHVPLQELGDGVYTVQWQALAEDGHTTDGSFFFIVGQATPDRQSFISMLQDDSGGDSQVNPAEPFVRALIFLAEMVLVGVPVAMLWVIAPTVGWGSTNSDATEKSLRRLLLFAAIAALVGAIGLVLAQMFATYGAFGLADAQTFLQDTGAGRALALRGGLMLLVVLVILALKQPRLWCWIALLGGIGLVLSMSRGSHSMAMVGTQGFWSDLGHALGAGLWGGGLVVLAFFLPPRLTHLDPEDVRQTVATAIRRFSTIGIVATALILGLGFLLTRYHVPTWGAFVETTYGSVVGVKAALFVIAIGMGGLHRFVMHRQLLRSRYPLPYAQRFIRSVRLEMVIVLLVFGLAGILTSVAPAHIVLAEQEGPQPVTVMGDTDVVHFHLNILPLQVGMNLFDLRVYDEGVPVSADSVENLVLFMRHADAEVQLPQVPLEAVSDTVYSAMSSFTLNGRWRLRVGGIINGKFKTHTFALDLDNPTDSAGGVDHSQHQLTNVEPSTLPRLLNIGAMATAVLAVLGLGFELFDYRRSIT